MYFEFDTSRRVTTENVAAGNRTYTFAYEPTAELILVGYSQWQRKTVETRPDESTKTVITNYIGQVLLHELKDESGDKVWPTASSTTATGSAETLDARSLSGEQLVGFSTSSNLTVTLRTSATA